MLKRIGGLRAGRQGAARAAATIALLCAMLMLCVASRSEALSYVENAWRYQPLTTLAFDVGFSHESHSGDYGEGKQFIHEYDLTFGGNIFDPRLLSYRATMGFQGQRNSDYYGEDYKTRKFGLELSFFNRIDRNRGLKIWRYMPSPVTLSFFNYDTTYATINNYGIGMYYIRPGFVRFFGPEGFMAYQLRADAAPSNVQNTNRYRLKYDANANFNGGNGNGNGNWNRNGNGNWNRNGNGNWNRNGNGNNPNDNANDNSNDNSNWSRNAGGNPGAGNFGNLGNGNWGQIQQKAKKPLLLSFPEMAMNYNWYNSKDKSSGVTDKLTSGSVRITSHYAENNEKAKRKYSSFYGMYLTTYTYRSEGSSSDIDSLRLEAKNRWTKVNTQTSVEDRSVNDQDTLSAAHYTYYTDTIRDNLKYMVGVQGAYKKTDYLTTYNYGAVLVASQMLSKESRLTPKLVSNASMGISVSRENDTVTDGIRTPGENRYSINVTEVLTSYYLDHSIQKALFSTGYTESGIPFYFRFTDVSKGYDRLSYSASYEFESNYEEAYGDRSTSHILSLNLGYQALSTLKLRNKWELSEHKEPFETDGDRVTSMLAGVDWKISSSTNSLLEFTVVDDEVQKSYDARASVRSSLSTRTEARVTAAREWDDTSDGSDDKLNAALSWKFRQIVFSSEFEKVTYRDDTTRSTLYFGIKRRFNANIGRMF